MILFNDTRTASFDVDAEKTFTSLCPNELPVVGGDEIVDELNAQAEFAGYRIGSKDAHCRNAIWIATEEKPQFTPVDGENVDIRWNPHGIMGTKGAEMLDGLPLPKDYDFFVWKGIEPDMHPYGACYHDLKEELSTGVIEYLKQKNVSSVIVGGLALDYCVKTTAIQLAEAGFNVIINLAATRGISEETIKIAKKDMHTHNIIFVNCINDIQVALNIIRHEKENK